MAQVHDLNNQLVAQAGEINRLRAALADVEAERLHWRQVHTGCHAERDDLAAKLAECERERDEARADLAESDREDDARRRFDAAIREGTNAMMREALGAEMYNRLWGVELERLGYACDALRTLAQQLCEALRRYADADYKHGHVHGRFCVFCDVGHHARAALAAAEKVLK